MTATLKTYIDQDLYSEIFLDMCHSVDALLDAGMDRPHAVAYSTLDVAENVVEQGILPLALSVELEEALTNNYYSQPLDLLPADHGYVQ